MEWTLTLAAGAGAAGQWAILLEILILLAAALVLGTVAEQLKQSAIVGYLLAGAIVGPNALNIIQSADDVELIAELGVSLLLFSIGLEFSLRRLRQVGPVAFGGGTLQVVTTLIAVGAIALAFGQNFQSSLAIGAILALSSTACVLRVLINESAIDSIYGRSTFGILLLQDIAVIPLVILMTVLVKGGTPVEIATLVGKTLLFGGLFIAAMWALINFAVPHLLHMRSWSKNRELPILLAIVLAGGSAWGAHYVGLSPAIGAFVAGMLLAESPFATQVRADVGSMRIVLVTLFFASIGMFLDPAWAATHLPAVLGLMAAIIVGKAVLITGVVRMFIKSNGMAAATGLCLAQVGEFAFVLVAIGYIEGKPDVSVVSENVFDLIIAATIGTLFVTPYLVRLAPSLAGWVERRTAGRPLSAALGESAEQASGDAAEKPEQDAASPAPGEGGEAVTGDADEAEVKSAGPDEPAPRDQIVLIGFGPAGMRVAELLLKNYKDQIIVIDLNARNAEVAHRYGLRTYVGDATRAELLEHLPLSRIRDVVVTIPDPEAARQIVHHCRYLCPDARVLARARYHVYRWELMLAGAAVVIDEEEQVGLRLAAEVRSDFHEDD